MCVFLRAESEGAVRQAIIIPEGSHFVSFTSTKRIYMKGHRDNGLVWSYSIIKVARTEDVIEEG